MANNRKLNVDDLAGELGVGRSTITAMRRMMGIPVQVRKMLPKPFEKFMLDYPDFTNADAANAESVAKFKQRYPKFPLPAWAKQTVVEA